MLLFKSDKGTASAVDSRLHKMPCANQNAFIHCLGRFCQRELLEFYGEQCEQRLEPELRQWQPERRQ